MEKQRLRCKFQWLAAKGKVVTSTVLRGSDPEADTTTAVDTKATSSSATVKAKRTFTDPEGEDAGISWKPWPL